MPKLTYVILTASAHRGHGSTDVREVALRKKRDCLVTRAKACFASIGGNWPTWNRLCSQPQLRQREAVELPTTT